MNGINGLNDESILDVRKAITGKDGRLFVADSTGNNIFLAEVDTFQTQINLTNIDIQPVGSALSYAVNTSYTITLTMTEIVIRDDVMIDKLISDMQKGYFPSFNFTGKLRRRDGKVETIVYRNCVPDGNIDLQSITPGDVIKRSWSFRVNASPDLQSKFDTVTSWNPVE